ncbi:MAG: nitroreductase/quinone reductase family protein [Candidatus Promineifilaceae bacterium]
MKLPHQPNAFNKLIAKIASSAPGAAVFARVLHPIDGAIIRWSKGRTSAAAVLAGLPVVSLTATGAKSGKKRTLPLIGIPDGDNIVLIASNWGQQKHPAWYYNVRTNPDVSVGFEGGDYAFTAREVTDSAERADLWNKAVKLYAGYNAYRQRASHRQIPIVLLSPA